MKTRITFKFCFTTTQKLDNLKKLIEGGLWINFHLKYKIGLEAAFGRFYAKFPLYERMFGKYNIAS